MWVRNMQAINKRSKRVHLIMLTLMIALMAAMPAVLSEPNAMAVGSDLNLTQSSTTNQSVVGNSKNVYARQSNQNVSSGDGKIKPKKTRHASSDNDPMNTANKGYSSLRLGIGAAVVALTMIACIVLVINVHPMTI